MRGLLAAALAVGASVVGLSVVGLSAGGPSPVAADPVTSCSAPVGVIVVVDFSPWGGAAQRGCAPTATDGYDAMVQAGFTPAGDAQDGTAFVCRIDGYPTEAQTPCATTPPASATWSYWHSAPGQSGWSYSTVGAMSYHPPAGSVDAWIFGPADTAPSFPPSSVRAAPTAPTAPTETTTTAAPPPTTAPPTGGGSTAPAASGGGPTGGAPSSGPDQPSGASTGTTGTVTPSTPDSTTTSAPPGRRTPAVSHVRIVDASPAGRRSAGSGSPLPFVGGALGVLALGGLAAWAALRRRHQAR